MNLTPHELDVIRLLADGHTNRQIAAQLKSSTTTVIDDIARLYRKLGAHDRESVLAAAARLRPTEEVEQ